MKRALASFSILLCIATGAVAQESQRAQLNEVEADLKSSKQDEAALAAQISSNRAHLDKLGDQSRNLAANIQDTESRVSAQEANADKLQDGLTRKQKEFDARREEYAQTVVSLLRLHRLPPTAIFAQPDNIHPLLRTASLLEQTNSAIAQRALELRKQMDELDILKHRTTQSQAQLRKERESLEGQQQNLSHELAERQEAQSKLSRDHEQAEARVAALTKQSGSLQELIGKLENQPIFGRSRHEHGGDFAAAKGNMKKPAVGDVVHRFGERKNENESWRGMVVAARAGGTVVAPWDGEVVFTGPFMEYGRIVLLKHANGYISLLAGLGTIEVTLNQEVKAGEPLGMMPQTPAPTLYVELRDHSKPIDPTGWFANVGQPLAKS